MASTVNMFNIGKSGLLVSKQAMSVTSHNIANVNSEGFSRQEVQGTSMPPLRGSDTIAFGNGARAKAVSRVTDEFLTKRIMHEAKNLGNAEEKETYLLQTEQVFNESHNDGVNRLATRLFNEFRSLSSDPANTAIRASVREASAQLAGEVRRVDGDLRTVVRNIDARIEGYVREVNALAREVRDLNLSIGRAELGGSDSPDLRDKLDLTLKRLGALVDISTSKDQNGRVSVTLGGAIPIVAGENVSELATMRTPPDPVTGKREDRLDIFIKNDKPDGVPEKVTRIIKHGRIGGLLEVRDSDIGSAQDTVNRVAHAITTEMNRIHRMGYGLDGMTGRDFFVLASSPAHAAEEMYVDQGIMHNLDSIAAAKEPGAEGDNRIAVALSGVGDMRGVVGDHASSILDTYNSIVSELAVRTETTRKESGFQKDVLTQLENVRESLSGVSLDEETANLVRYQHAYAANAKVIQVADEGLQTILGLIR